MDQELPNRNVSTKAESWASYIFLAAIIISPLAFWPARYLPLNVVKTLVIVIGSLLPAILLGYLVLKEKKVSLPPRNILWTGMLLIASLLISSLLSINIERSLFGQGFEIGTAGFIGALLVAALVAFALISRRPERAMPFYKAGAMAFGIIYLFHLLRLIFGAKLMSFSLFNAMTDSPLGNWFSLGIYAAVIAVVTAVGLITMPLSKGKKAMGYFILALSLVGAAFTNLPSMWLPLALVALGLTIYFGFVRSRDHAVDPDGSRISFVRRLSWLSVALFIIYGLFAWKGPALLGPLAQKSYGGYTEASLPWQMTLDVASQTIKGFPFFGIGPNHFGQAFLAFKPAQINMTDAWNIEFMNGFGLIPTLVAGQGMVGLILWVLFFVFFGIAGKRASANLPLDPSKRFVMISSFAAATFLWILLVLYVPSHSIAFLAFALTGMFYGSAVAYGSLSPKSYAAAPVGRSALTFPIFMLVLIVVAALWSLTYARKAVALSFFGRGVSELTVSGDPIVADGYFKKAQTLDSSDVFWQARAESSLMLAGKLYGTLTSATPASTTEAVMAQIASATNDALAHARSAIAYDPSNYYNFISEARVSEVAASLGMANSVENGVNAYKQAIARNPFNPSLYLNLARFLANAGKFDDSLQVIGAALEAKNNYLDAIFLLSQVHAAKGNLDEAIVAANVALEVNPNDPLLHFQLGILEFNAKNYLDSAAALEKAVELQPDYANAKYFLGLSEARLGQNAKAIQRFEDLAESNPDNPEIDFILTNLKAGRPIFADAVPPVTPNPEKRKTLPIREQ